jgi:hypothetical protein
MRLKIIRHVLVQGPKSAYRLGKALHLRPFLAGRSLRFLQEAGLVKFEGEKPSKAGKPSKVFGLTLRGLLVGINSYVKGFEVDETSLVKAAQELDEIMRPSGISSGVADATRAFETTVTLGVKLRSLTTGRTIGEELDNAIQYHGHLIPLISNKWKLFQETGIDHFAKFSLLAASNSHIFWEEARETTWAPINALVYDWIKKDNAFLKKLRQDEFTAGFLMFVVVAYGKSHILPFLEPSIGSAFFEALVARLEPLSRWFGVIAKDKELRETVLEYVTLRIDALTEIRKLLAQETPQTP